MKAPAVHYYFLAETFSCIGKFMVEKFVGQFFGRKIFLKECPSNVVTEEKYQPSGAGGTRSPPATAHRLQNPKWPPGGPEMADGVRKGV